MGKRGTYQTPPGVPDPLFLHELALKLHMTVGDMCNRMSAHELTVLWPAYFAHVAHQAELAENSSNTQAVPV